MWSSCTIIAVMYLVVLVLYLSLEDLTLPLLLLGVGVNPSHLTGSLFRPFRCASSHILQNMKKADMSVFVLGLNFAEHFRT